MRINNHPMALARLLGLGLVCALVAADAATLLHEAEVRHVRCEVHGGWRHDDAPDESPADLHTDDHDELRFFQQLVTPSVTQVVPVIAVSAPLPPSGSQREVYAARRVWAFAPKGSPPRV